MMDALDKLCIGEIFDASCEDVSFEGKGVCFVEGKAGFVPSMLPGDEGEIEIEYRRNGVYFGKLKKLDRFSSIRISPACKVASACGGCAFQNASYEGELELKRKLVIDQLRRQGIETEVRKTLSGDPVGYRNKVAVPFGKNSRGELVYGFYKEGTHRIIENDGCLNNDPRADALLRKLLPFLREEGVTAYDEKEHSGDLRHALIRAMKTNAGLMLVLVLKSDSLLHKKGFVEHLQEKFPEITSCFANINKKRGNVILDGQMINLFGDRHLIENIDGMSFGISPNSFFQVNSKMAEILYKTAIDSANISKEDIVFDAYSGTGSIGLLASRYAKEVHAVEVVGEAVYDALENAKENSVTNYTAEVGDATEWMVNAAKEKRPIDILFTDPPRKGCTPEFIDAALKLAPKKIVYVSCNPVTLARDLKPLLASYKLLLCQPVDMFPRTMHVETIVLLQRKTSQN